MELRHRIHTLLCDEELRLYLEGEAMASTSPPKDGIELAWRDGRRAMAAELISIYREVEDEYRTTRMGEQSPR
jgi:hypothetical protein